MKMTSTTLRGKNRIFGKAIAVLAVSFGALAFAQQRGSFGFNTVTPKATMEINVATENASGTTVEGIVIPNVTTARATAMRTNPKESTLVYITDGVAGTGTTSNVSGKGFYYYDTATSKWVKVGAGSGSGTDTSLYANNGSLTGKRTVTHNNNVLTFTTGTGQFVVDGTTNLKGNVYKSHQYLVTSQNLPDTGYLFENNTGTAVTVGMPVGQKGREVCFFVTGTGSYAFTVDMVVGQQITVAPSAGACFMSNGTQWLQVTGY